jgi:hypothetical protein
MAAGKPTTTGKKNFTVAEANATLPLVRAIISDIMALARDLRDRHERLTRLRGKDRGVLGEAYQEEMKHVQDDFERDQERMQEYEQELHDLGVELKDHFTGLLDFPCRMHGREVYLCWRAGEAEVAYWHELDAGFAGRQRLRAEAHNR